MVIKTKYNIGDVVWMLLLNEPEEFIITGIEYTHHRIYVGCRYYIKSTSCEYEVKIPEELLFPDKQELLNSLKHE